MVMQRSVEKEWIGGSRVIYRVYGLGLRLS